MNRDHNLFLHLDVELVCDVMVLVKEPGLEQVTGQESVETQPLPRCINIITPFLQIHRFSKGMKLFIINLMMKLARCKDIINSQLPGRTESGEQLSTRA